MSTGMGDVHVSLSGLGRTQGIAAAVLTDSVRGTWVYHGPGHDRAEPAGDVTGPLALRPSSDRSSLDLFFAPYRDETGATLTLRLIGQDGKMTVARFAGGACDPARRAPPPAASRVDAKPGDDLAALANQYGTVSLAPGTYRLTRPLVLEKPVTLTAEGKATLLFSQAPGRCSLDDGDQDPLGSYDLERIRRPVRGADPVGPGSQLRTGGHRHDRQSRSGEERLQGGPGHDPARPREPCPGRPLEMDRSRAPDEADERQGGHDRRQHPLRRSDRVLRRPLAVRQQ